MNAKLHPAQFFEPGTSAGSVRCLLCPHRCMIPSGKMGLCSARRNDGGTLVSLSYGRVTAAHVDPIEKKPLYHFHPGSKIFSVGSFGCNFRCAFCQNWEISQVAFDPSTVEEITPEGALEVARRYHSIGIAFTYNEPLVNIEWMLETAALFRTNGLKNVLVTNGFVNPEPLAALLPLIDAANVDIKSLSEEFYRKLCGGSLAPVLETVKTLHQTGVHVELTNLIIPGENDSIQEIERLSGWVADLSPDIPLHFSRYFPRYRMETAPTPVETLNRAYETAQRCLRYVYVGNVENDRFSTTYCPSCGAVLFERHGYDVHRGKIHDGCCSACGTKIALIS